jgi:excisionase family DNA binding protein
MLSNMANTGFTLRAAARRLGVHHATLRRWIQDGEGPRTFIKQGRRCTYRIAPTALETFIEQNSKGK